MVNHMPTVVYDGPLPTRRVGFGMLIRGQSQEVSQESLDLFRGQLINCRIWDDKTAPAEEVTVDEGGDGIPDMGWTRNDIATWLKDAGVRTRAGLTKAQLISRVGEHLNPVETEEVTEDINGEEGLAKDETE